MVSNHNTHLPYNSLYKKAQDIIKISRRISNYLSHDLSNLNDVGQEDNAIYFTGDIIQQSSSLTPEIINAQNEVFSEAKEKHVASLNRLTSLLNKNCDRLEKVNSNGKDFLPILRKELNKFRKLQHTWMLTL